MSEDFYAYSWYRNLPCLGTPGPGVEIYHVDLHDSPSWQLQVKEKGEYIWLGGTEIFTRKIISIETLLYISFLQLIVLRSGIFKLIFSR